MVSVKWKSTVWKCLESGLAHSKHKVSVDCYYYLLPGEQSLITLLPSRKVLWVKNVIGHFSDPGSSACWNYLFLRKNTISAWISRCVREVITALFMKTILNKYTSVFSSRGIQMGRLTDQKCAVWWESRAWTVVPRGSLILFYLFYFILFIFFLFLTVWVSEVIMVALWGVREMGCEGLCGLFINVTSVGFCPGCVLLLFNSNAFFLFFCFF